MNRIFVAVLSLMVLTLVASCSSTTLTASWKNPEYGKFLDKVYIVGVAKNNTTRRIFEDSFKQELAKTGVAGIVSYKSITAEEDNKDIIMQKALENRADSILISRMVKKRTETVETPGRITTYKTGEYYPYNYSPHYRYYNDYYSHRYETIYEPPTVSRFEVATIESNIYGTDSGELIWSAQFETVVDGNLQRIINDFIAVVINDLKAKALI
ncbi:MAG: hypothetical protein C0623_04815 [Desulfuromonas sp.]|nr:MAG: hypothetical protein C0623_04815 [Desulfuromonas sp.]